MSARMCVEYIQLNFFMCMIANFIEGVAERGQFGGKVHRRNANGKVESVSTERCTERTNLPLIPLDSTHMIV